MMIDYIGNLTTLYSALVEGFQSINLDSKSRKKQHIQLKICTIQCILDNIVKTADKTFSVVDLKLNKEVVLNAHAEQELKYLANSQANNLNELLMILEDNTFDFTLKLFSPHLGNEVIDKIERIKNCLFDQIKRLYNIDKDDLQKLCHLDDYLLGLKNLSQLKNCSRELSAYISTNLDFTTNSKF